MATTTNYGWTTPDDTALVKDGAAAIRTLGSSVDTTTKALNPSTTLGDIEYRSSTANTNTRLGIGTTGQVLSVAGGVPTWATPAGSSDNFTLLNSGGTSLSGSSVSITGISGKNKLFVVVVGASTSGTGSNIKLGLNTDTGNNYVYFGFSTLGTTIFRKFNDTGDSGYLLVDDIQSAAQVYNAGINIQGTNATGYKPFQVNTNNNTGGSDTNMVQSTGYYTGASAISSVEIRVSAGSFDAGTIYVYGA
jgi:hypothetical protein